MGLTGFDWVFNRFYRNFTAVFTEFFLVLLGFNRFYCGFTGFY